MRSGCISYILKIGTAVVSAFLLAAGTLVLFFGAFNLDSSGGVLTITTAIVGVVAIYLFIRVGKDILRDLRGESDDGENSDSKPN